MKILTALMLMTAISLTPALGVDIAKRIDVDCETERALERALARAQKLREVDIYLHGVCEGNYVISSGRVTFRGATPESGLAAPEGA